MRIKLTCTCGRVLSVSLNPRSDQESERRLRCPKCRQLVEVPYQNEEPSQPKLLPSDGQPDPATHSDPAQRGGRVQGPPPIPPPIQTQTAVPPPPAPETSSPAPSIGTDNSERPVPQPKVTATDAVPGALAALADSDDSTTDPAPNQPLASQVPADQIAVDQAARTEPASPAAFPAPIQIDQGKSAEAAVDASIPIIEIQYYESFEQASHRFVNNLAMILFLCSLVGAMPAILQVGPTLLARTEVFVARWSYLLIFVTALQWVYAIYLVHLPHWSAVRVVALGTLILASGYAMFFAIMLLGKETNTFVVMLELVEYVRAGTASAWCLLMLCLLAVTAYVALRQSLVWSRH